ncbi:hypothetical protein VchM-138_0036 [Vibrio phage vB_VchM-138]|uniref:HNH nuclease domain-containing protein n=1 Tax=Vibrio phage Rostov M3 TaxID=2660724 RepID=A0A5Q2WCE0_9CAUD|nr:hypothetical protein F397_gp36 [Vibrio phage vB_VchM-138]AFC22715.1 hypothetical protein VchM-138_0036 [Vibrio phage vB_VchM-138]QGH75048.1 hypothetical protein RostovM3_00006 [Vibrio phage Rostov M3]
MEIISRAEAKQLGLTHYFTGKPCKHGHVTKRFTGTAICIECNRLNAIKMRVNNPEYIIRYRSTEDYKNRTNNHRKQRLKDDPDFAARCRVYDRIRNHSPRRVKACRDRSQSKEGKAYRRAYIKAYNKNKYATDLDFVLITACRNMIRRMINNGVGKNKPTVDLLGYNHNNLRVHIESQFKDGMTWANYGEWHIDHIVPVSWWISQGIDDPSIINALDNLQPLWAADNLSKGAKI